MDYKNIHIGTHIKHIATCKELSISRACTFLKCSHQDILDMYCKKSLDSELLLRWCKLLDYNFFMFYHTHLQIFKPLASTTKILKNSDSKRDEEYVFRKNIYSKEIINWILEKLNKEELSVKDVIEKYNIPKTTIYRWIQRNHKNKNYETN